MLKEYLFFSLKSQIQDREKLEMKIEAMEENLRLTNCLLSKTQVLLLTERNNCQQMALHIDLLKVSLNFIINEYKTYN